MRKLFEQADETRRIVHFFVHMKMGERATFAELSQYVRFQVRSTTPAYQSAKRIAERDHGIYIASLRGVGFARGTGSDMASSLSPMAHRMKRIARKSVARADLAISNNLPRDEYDRVVEQRSRASIIYSTSSAPLAASNREKPPPAREAPPHPGLHALRTVEVKGA